MKASPQKKCDANRPDFHEAKDIVSDDYEAGYAKDCYFAESK